MSLRPFVAVPKDLREWTRWIQDQIIPDENTTDPGISTINTQDDDYTLVLSDKGKTIRKATSDASKTHTIPANASVSFAIGTWVAWQNDGTVAMSIAITTDTLTGTDGVTGTRTLGANDTAVIQKVAATEWKYAASDL